MSWRLLYSGAPSAAERQRVLPALPQCRASRLALTAFIAGLPQSFKPHWRQPMSCWMAKLQDSTSLHPQVELFLPGHTFLCLYKPHCSIPRLHVTTMQKQRSSQYYLMYWLSCFISFLPENWWSRVMQELKRKKRKICRLVTSPLLGHE